MDDKEKLQNTVILGLANPPSDADITERFTMARSHLRTAAFPEHLRPIWEALQRYFILTGAIIDESDLTTALKGNGMTEAKAFEYATLYRKFREATQHVTTPKFKFAVVRLLEEIKKEKLTQTLTDAAQVLMEGKDIDGKHYFGYSDARKVMAVSTTELERISGTLPEALLQASTGAMWDEYLSVKGGKSHAGLLTGFDFVDKATLGFSPGELIMLGAYCQPAGEYILLERGLVDIEEADIGEVVPGQGRILNKWYFPPQTIVSVKASCSLSTSFTLDHPIPVIRRQKVGARLCSASCNQKHRHNKLEQDLLLPAQDVACNDWLRLPRIAGAEQPVAVDFSRDHHYPAPSNALLMRIAAVYVSNGNVGSSAEVCLTFGKRMYAEADLLLSQLKAVGFSCSLLDREQHGETEYKSLIIYSTSLKQWVLTHFGRGALRKRIPGWVLRLRPALVQEFLDWYLDGSWHLRDREGRTWTSFNKQLILSIVLLLAKVGKVGCLQEIPTGKTAYLKSQPISYRYTVSGLSSRVRILKDEILVPVRKVKLLAEKKAVIGIQTESGYYLAPFLVHNTSEGKTTLLENICYDVAFNQGKNVVVATAESTERQVRRRIACLHSRRSAKFTHKGLEYKAVKSGMLSLDEEEHYKVVLEDIRTGGYGKIQVFQLPHKATVSYIVDRLVSYQVLFNVDFFALDYLNLVHAERRRVEKREEIDDVIVEMKQVAVSFDGRGIPVVTPWQIKQTMWVDAKKSGRYTLACLSNSSEAEKSCDVCWTIIRREGDLKTLNSQILKNRDGERREDPVELQAEWNYGYIYQKDDQTDYTKGLGNG